VVGALLVAVSVAVLRAVVVGMRGRHGGLLGSFRRIRCESAGGAVRVELAGHASHSPELHPGELELGRA
jgi:hypothetical protein